MEKLIVPMIIEALEKGDKKYIRNVFENLHPGDASDILENLSSDEIIMIIKILPENTIFPIMEEVEPEKFTDILNLLEDEWLAEVLDAIPPDDGVDILQLLPDDRASEIIDLMNRFESEKVKQLLPYPENTAGAVMTTEVTTLPANITVGKAIEFLRKLSARRETILYIYIVDKEKHLLGTVSFEDLVFSNKFKQLSEIMDTEVFFSNVMDDKEEVARDIQRYDLIALPIVNDENVLLGIVTYDDVMDILVDESTEDTQLMAAVEPLHTSYLHTGFWSLIKRRIIWLSILFFGEFISALNLRNFHGTLESMISIAFFIPLIIATAGNTGTQSASLIISGLALGEIDLRKWFKVFIREILTGLVMGVILAIFGTLAVYALGGNIVVSLIVSSTLLIMIIVGSTLGSMLPLIFKHFNIDPALTSSPFVTTSLDVIGILIYIGVSTLIINHLF